MCDMSVKVWEDLDDLFNVNHYIELDISKVTMNPTQAEHLMKWFFYAMNPIV
jgi:predicted ATP-dependent Lon-type protease